MPSFQYKKSHFGGGKDHMTAFKLVCCKKKSLAMKHSMAQCLKSWLVWLWKLAIQNRLYTLKWIFAKSTCPTGSLTLPRLLCNEICRIQAFCCNYIHYTIDIWRWPFQCVVHAGLDIWQVKLQVRQVDLAQNHQNCIISCFQRCTI